MVHIIVLLWSTANYFKEFITKKAVKLSRPDVGSSNSKIEGSDIISNAIDVLFLSPPLYNIIIY